LKSFLALLAFLTQAGLHMDRVTIPAPDGVALDAALVLPDGPPRGAAAWLTRRPRTPPGGVDLIGWSNGGGTVLYTAAQRPDLPPGLFRRFVAFYPGCATVSRDEAWQPSGPLMILVGESDDWTPAAPCHDLAARFPGQVVLARYPGAFHDFDAPDREVEERSGLATPPSDTGHAHTGTNEPAREDALRRVPAYLDAGH
jgi:dienelactone hydrolase